MAHQSLKELIESLDNDLPRSAMYQKKVPALAEAFDAERMKTNLQEALVGPAEGRYSIVKCVPGKALYLLDHTINMQFKLEVLDNTNNETTATLVNARLFRDAAACRAFLHEVMITVDAWMDGLQAILPYASTVELIARHNM